MEQTRVPSGALVVICALQQVVLLAALLARLQSLRDKK
jgi:hypothetical protein